MSVLRSAAKWGLRTAGRVEGLAERLWHGPRATSLDADPHATDSAAASAAIDPAGVRSLLIWSMDGMGDVVRATPAIRALRERFSGARMGFVAAGRAAAILGENPCLDFVHDLGDPFRLRSHRRALRAVKGSWDLGVLMEVGPAWTWFGCWWFRLAGVRRWLCFDFGDGTARRAIGVSLGAGGSWIQQFNRLAEAAGGRAGTRTEVHLSPAEREQARALLGAEGVDPDAPFFLIHPGGNFLKVSRQWPPEAFAALVELLRQRWPHPVVITGVQRERPVVEAIRARCAVPIVDLCGRLSMRQLAAVISWSGVCIMNDTGPMHVAHALQRRTVVVLGPTGPEIVGVPDWGRVVRADLPCSPCAFFLGWQSCSNPNKWECLSSVSPQMVFAAVEAQMRHAAGGVR